MSTLLNKIVDVIEQKVIGIGLGAALRLYSNLGFDLIHNAGHKSTAPYVWIPLQNRTMSLISNHD